MANKIDEKESAATTDREALEAFIVGWETAMRNLERYFLEIHVMALEEYTSIMNKAKDADQKGDMGRD